ncbi:MAG: dTDP-4-dehydrorhamnose reductase [Patescibacteria group bacterium]|jgi:dTDP-4-dehydrorhamnose reductase
MQKVIVTGAKGMLGQEIVRVFSENPGYNVVAWDMENLDITDGRSVTVKLTAAEPQIVINCAAYNNVDGAEVAPEKAKLLNATAVAHLATTCAELGATLVHFSTDYVFAGTKQGGYVESDTPDPVSVYGQSKADGELEAAKNPQHYVVRLSRLFGKPAKSENAKRSFVDVMLQLAKEQPTIEVVEAEFSSPTYAPDLAEATLHLVQSEAPFGIYHRTNAGACTWYTFAQEILRVAGRSVPVTPVPPEKYPRPAKRPGFSQLQTTKLPALRPWQEALADYLKGSGTA